MSDRFAETRAPEMKAALADDAPAPCPECGSKMVECLEFCDCHWCAEGVARPTLSDGPEAGTGFRAPVPATTSRENFPPASGTVTPLVASGDQNESDPQLSDGSSDG